MCEDLRFKHPFTCIISRSSGYRHFALNCCKISNRCLLRPSSTVAFCGATVRTMQSPLSTSEEEYSFTKVRQTLL